MSHFSINKSVWLGVLLFLTCGMLFAQPTNPKPIPNICVNTNPPPAGYTRNTDFLHHPGDKCTSASSTTLNVTFQGRFDAATSAYLTSTKFYIDADLNFNFTTPSTPAIPAVPVAGIPTLSRTFAPGWYWVVMEGVDVNGSKRFSCKEFEVLSTTTPNVDLTSCGPNSVTLTIPSDAVNKYDRYLVDWGDTFIQEVKPTASQPLPITLTRTYTGGIPDIQIEANYIRGSALYFCPTQKTTLKPPTSTKPILTELNGENQGTEVTIKFDNYEAGKNYSITGYIDDGTGSGTPVKNMAVGQNGAAKITGLSGSNRYCFYTESIDGCNNPVRSDNILCSIKLDPTLISSSEVNLNWNLPSLLGIPTPNNLALFRDVVGCANCQTKPVLTNLTSYNDKTLICSQKYLYQVETKYPVVFNTVTKNIIIRSAKMTVDPQSLSAPPVPNDLMLVSYDANNEDIVQLRIDTDIPAAKYQFLRAEGNSANFIPVGSSVNTNFDDVSIINKDVQYCYKYQLEDACGNPSAPSPAFCTVLLKSNQPGTLNWTAFTLPPSAYNVLHNTTYTVEYFDPTFGTGGGFIPIAPTDKLIQSVQAELNNSTQIDVKFRISSIQVIDIDGTANFPVPSYSNTFTFIIPPRIYAPTAFTPNGDGYSEKFKVFTKFVASGKITIYDNWGSAMFSSDDVLTAEWDGKLAGGDTAAPMGTYAYKIVGVSDAGKDFTFKGSILLLR